MFTLNDFLLPKIYPLDCTVQQCLINVSNQIDNTGSFQIIYWCS